jgi:hypothetical protein
MEIKCSWWILIIKLWLFVDLFKVNLWLTQDLFRWWRHSLFLELDSWLSSRLLFIDLLNYFSVLLNNITALNLLQVFKLYFQRPIVFSAPVTRCLIFIFNYVIWCLNFISSKLIWINTTKINFPLHFILIKVAPIRIHLVLLAKLHWTILPCLWLPLQLNLFLIVFLHVQLLCLLLSYLKVNFARCGFCCLLLRI